MGLFVSPQPAPPRPPRLSRITGLTLLLSIAVFSSQAQSISPATTTLETLTPPTHTLRAQRFLAGRALGNNSSAAQAMDGARQQQARAAAQPRDTTLSASWQSIGPNQIATAAYGNVTGRITAIAIDPADATGNTVYLGTTGGGVWKSTNAAGPTASVTFAPLTDTLPVFSANARNAAIPSLSIGAISVNSGVILAGTGDPNDATDSFYGDGILRSTDGGLTWTLIQNSQDGATGNHSFLGLGFSAFAWSTAAPNLAVAAVSQAAEGTLVNAPSLTNSVMGLYYSTDSGATWQMATIMDGTQTVQDPEPSGLNAGGNAATSVIWNPIRQRFYAAIRYHGYYESADGITWTRLTHQPGTALTTTACPTSPGTTGSLACPIFRGALAVQPITGDTFALTVDRNNTDQGLWQDQCALSGTNCASAITFATRLPSTPLEVGNGNATIPQADYNLTLAAVPAGTGSTQDTLLYAGTIDLYRCSLAAGCTLRNTTNALNGCAAPAMVAPAQHAIAILATSTQPLLYLGNDGGLWRSLDGVNQQSTPCSPDDATHFQNLNSGLGSLAETLSFAQHPTDPATLLAGLGANGTAATSASTPGAWPQLSAGEGGTVAIDPANPGLWYISTAAGVSIRQCTLGSGCTAANFTGAPTIGLTQTSSDASLIDAPWLLDPALISNVVIGTCRIWRGPAATGSSWSSSNAISRMLGGTQSTACTATNPAIRSLAASGPATTSTSAQNSGSSILYAGLAGTLDGGGTLGGHIFTTTSAATATNTSAWTDIATSAVTNVTGGAFNPGNFDISSLAADPHDATGKTIYATIMGFVGNGINAAHLYRSTNAGATWTNISSNLPNAPANSVVIDPNDANTLYVALDTGVYVTTQVATCATTNCWSIYGTALPNAPVVALAASATLPTGDGRIGELRAATYGRGLWQIPLLTAATATQPAITLNPTSLTFAAQAVATASTPQTITVTNSGSATLTITQLTTPSDFTQTNTCTAAPIAINATCTVQITFAPTATGTRAGTLTIYGNVAGGQATAALTGTGTPAAPIVLTPLTLTFAATTINATTTAQNITISNTSTTPIALKTPTITGDFSIAINTCTSTLGPSTGCTVAITFTPTASGTRTGTFTITDDAGTQTASLSGIGTAPPTDALSPLALTFAPQQLTTASTPQTITLTNSGDVALTSIAAKITTGDFSVVNVCGNSLNPHSSCTISVTFQPTTVGPATGTLTISDTYRTQTISLTGTGVAPPGISLSPTYGITFPATGVGTTAISPIVTLTNNGGQPLTIATTTVTGDFAIVPGTNTCPATLAVSTACTLQLAFTPTAAGPRSGTLTLTDSSPTSPHTLPLTGTGVDFALTPDGNTTVTTQSGKNAVFPLLLSPATNDPTTLTATFACTGAPANSTCTVNPSTTTLDAPKTISVTILTGVSTTVQTIPQAGFQTPHPHPTLWLALLLPTGLLALCKHHRCTALICVLVLSSLLATSGCGTGRRIPGSGSSDPTQPSQTATPAGTYPITVSATSAGLTRTINLTLIVQ
jgi:hypothetical protein